jgi:hypothetical protein
MDLRGDPGPGLPQRYFGPRIGQQPCSGTKYIDQQHGDAQRASASEAVTNHCGQGLAVRLAEAAHELDLRLQFELSDKPHHRRIQGRPAAEQQDPDRSAQVSL